MLNLLLKDCSDTTVHIEKRENEKAYEVIFGSGFLGYLGGRLYGEARDGLGAAGRAPEQHRFKAFYAYALNQILATR